MFTLEDRQRLFQPLLSFQQQFSGEVASEVNIAFEGGYADETYMLQVHSGVLNDQPIASWVDEAIVVRSAHPGAVQACGSLLESCIALSVDLRDNYAITFSDVGICPRWINTPDST
jgi:hypothetical protein